MHPRSSVDRHRPTSACRDSVHKAESHSWSSSKSALNHRTSHSRFWCRDLSAPCKAQRPQWSCQLMCDHRVNCGSATCRDPTSRLTRLHHHLGFLRRRKFTALTHTLDKRRPVGCDAYCDACLQIEIDAVPHYGSPAAYTPTFEASCRCKRAHERERQLPHTVGQVPWSRPRLFCCKFSMVWDRVSAETPPAHTCCLYACQFWLHVPSP